MSMLFIHVSLSENFFKYWTGCRHVLAMPEYTGLGLTSVRSTYTCR